VFERFTPEARLVVVDALDEVRAFGHERVGSEHLLLGLLHDEGVAELLGPFDVTHERVWARVEEIVGPGEGTAEGQISFTPDGRRVLEGTLTEAAQLKQPKVAPGHILLGLLATVDCLGARVLLELGADAEAVRRAVIDRLTDR
jgi:ATP-dependent Clp protease ATP-binding subunit ClpC